MAKPIPVDVQRAAYAAFTFLSKFAPPSRCQTWNLVAGRRMVSLTAGSWEANDWLLANIRSKSGVCVSVKDLQYTSHLAIETHQDNITCFPARAMGAVRAGRNVSFLYRLVNPVDLLRANELARMAIDIIGGADLEFLFPLPGSIRHGVTVELKRVDPNAISRPTQFMMAAKSKDATTYDQRNVDLVNALRGFGVEVEPAGTKSGPVVTLHEITPGRGVRASRIVELAADLAMALGVESVRVDPATGRNTIGIEVPNEKREDVSLSNILDSTVFSESTAVLPLALGKAIDGTLVVVDLEQMPHLLLAGTTGSGKSVLINDMILSIVARRGAAEVGFIMIDLKRLELTPYNGIPHMALPVATDPQAALDALSAVLREMEMRHTMMEERGAKGIADYNREVRPADRLRRLVVVIDEMEELLMEAGQEVEDAVRRLARMARAAGIHLIIATQRPSADVMKGTLKANLGTRIACRTISAIDSRVILGEPGAEQLLGKGDMLYMAAGKRLQRIHGAFVDSREIRDRVRRLRSQPAPANRSAAFAEPALLREPQKLISLSAAASPQPEQTGTASERVARALKSGGLTTSVLMARTRLSRATLNRLADDGFVVRRPSQVSRETLWTLAG